MLWKSEYLFVVLWHGRSCQEMSGTIFVSWRTRRLNNSTKHQLHALTTIISKKKNWNPWENCQKYALKLFWDAYTWHELDDLIFLWSVNRLARSITIWTKACCIRLSRLISYIHHTCEYKQYCHVGKTAKQCRLGLFQDSDFAGDLEDSKSTSGGTLCIFGSHIRLFQLAGCVRNKLQFHRVQQNQVSFLLMQDWGWTVYPHLISGIWSSQFFSETRIRMINYAETRKIPNATENSRKDWWSKQCWFYFLKREFFS